MYVPRPNAMEQAGVAAFLERRSAAHLVTVGPDGIPDSTLLPVVVDGDRVLGHLARANEHWRRIAAGAPALVVVTGADAYVSPSWYASKAVHGRVVPTWNYTEVHLRGAVTIHDDPGWVLEVVTRLTDRHESGREHRWAVDDAPEAYVAGQLRAIIGVEVLVESVEGKAKLSQNRSANDRLGVIAGMRGDGDAGAHAVADDMERALHD